MMNNRKLQLVTFEQARKLRDLGFDWGVEDSTLFPVAIAMKWMRDVHNLSGEIISTASGWIWMICKACNDLTGGSTINDSHLDGPKR